MRDAVKMKKSDKKLIIACIAVFVVIIVVVIGIIAFLNAPTFRVKKHISLGNKYLNDVDYDRAVLAFKKALKIDGKSEESYAGLAAAYLGLEDYGMALDTVEKGIEVTGETDLFDYLKKEIARHYIDAGNVHLSEKRYAQAVTEYEKAIKIEEKNEEPYVDLAKSYFAIGQKDKALEAINKGIKECGETEKLNKIRSKILESAQKNKNDKDYEEDGDSKDDVNSSKDSDVNMEGLFGDEGLCDELIVVKCNDNRYKVDFSIYRSTGYTGKSTKIEGNKMYVESDSGSGISVLTIEYSNNDNVTVTVVEDGTDIVGDGCQFGGYYRYADTFYDYLRDYGYADCDMQYYYDELFKDTRYEEMIDTSQFGQPHEIKRNSAGVFSEMDLILLATRYYQKHNGYSMSAEVDYISDEKCCIRLYRDEASKGDWVAVYEVDTHTGEGVDQISGEYVNLNGENQYE